MGLKKKGSDGWRDERRTREEGERQRDQKGGQQRASERERQREKERAAQNMRLKCNVLERERESRASHAVRGNCTLAECGENKEKGEGCRHSSSIASLLISSYSPIRQQERSAAYITLHLKRNKPEKKGGGGEKRGKKKKKGGPGYL